jgi:hypothetical protein
MSIPTWVSDARKPTEIEQAANYLGSLDSLDAIEPLARLSCHLPGWLSIQLGLIVTAVASLGGFVVASFLTAMEIWLVAVTLRGLLQTLYPDWADLWWIGWGLLLAIWLWYDPRLRELVRDERFVLRREQLTSVCLIILWPFRVLAQVLRLCVALGFLTLMLSPPLMALPIIAEAWDKWQVRGLLSPQEPLTYCFVAGAVYLVFGLFVCGDWPRRARTARRRDLARLTWKQILLAIAIAFVLAMSVRALTPIYRNWAGSMSGIIYFLLWLRWSREWSFTDPLDFSWIKRVSLTLSRKQVRFLRFTLLLSALIGISGLISSVLTNYAKGSRGPSIGLVITLCGLALVYPFGLGIRLARPVAWPFFWLRRSVENLLEQVRAHLAVRRAVQYHRARNRKLVGERGSRAVCREHVARFEPRRVQLSYGRQWIYWRCRVCHRDEQAIPDVHVVRGVFDAKMIERLRLEGKTLLVNLLDQSGSFPCDLQEVCVKQVSDPHDVERFVVAYRNFASPVKIPRLKQIKLEIVADVHLGASAERMLRDNFRT